MIKLNKFYIGKSVEWMKENLPNNFIDLTVTSPPYDDLRSYNGFKFNYKTMLDELYRVTKDGGVVIWVVGDKVNKGSKTLTSFEQALYAKSIGFKVYDVIIYEKTSPSPPHKNRYFNSFEYMFVFSKGTPKTINLLKDRKNKTGGTMSGVLTRRESDGSLTTKKSIEIQEYGIRTNIWTYDVGNNKTTTDKIAYKHPAQFPEKLAKDNILSWSNEGDIIFDPMCGSGTTCKMAYLNNRKFIGIDISEEYINNICIPRLKEYGWNEMA